MKKIIFLSSITFGLLIITNQSAASPTYISCNGSLEESVIVNLQALSEEKSKESRSYNIDLNDTNGKLVSQKINGIDRSCNVNERTIYCTEKNSNVIGDVYTLNIDRINGNIKEVIREQDKQQVTTRKFQGICEKVTKPKF